MRIIAFAIAVLVLGGSAYADQEFVDGVRQHETPVSIERRYSVIANCDVMGKRLIEGTNAFQRICVVPR